MEIAGLADLLTPGSEPVSGRRIFVRAGALHPNPTTWSSRLALPRRARVRLGPLLAGLVWSWLLQFATSNCNRQRMWVPGAPWHFHRTPQSARLCDDGGSVASVAGQPARAGEGGTSGTELLADPSRLLPFQTRLPAPATRAPIASPPSSFLPPYLSTNSPPSAKFLQLNETFSLKLCFFFMSPPVRSHEPIPVGNRDRSECECMQPKPLRRPRPHRAIARDLRHPLGPAKRGAPRAPVVARGLGRARKCGGGSGGCAARPARKWALAFEAHQLGSPARKDRRPRARPQPPGPGMLPTPSPDLWNSGWGGSGRLGGWEFRPIFEGRKVLHLRRGGRGVKSGIVE